MESPDIPSSSKPHYVTKFDVVPDFWQFLNGLKSDDIIAELIQNDLDAGAEQTCIIFTENRLICEGNGQPVDEEGWNRLTFIRGAGDQVPRKRNRIGIKNHGLKACFTIGDEIFIWSAGKYLCQTLYKNGFDLPPHPGAFDKPLSDSQAPAIGCRIEVPYRLTDLVTPVGEPLTFTATSPETIERVFRKASQEISQLFLGVLRPTIREKYAIILEHHSLGYARFEFKCGRPQKSGRMKFFSRVCEVCDANGEKTQNIKERACIFKVPFPDNPPREIPDFYRAGNGFYAEIAWQINSRGDPVGTCGHLRYPITYPANISTARNGLGVHYSAPYISDTSRHGTSESCSSFNQHVSEHLDKELIKLLRKQLMPPFGPKALNLLVDPKGYEDERLKQMVQLLLNNSAIPLAPKISKAKFRSKASKPKIRFGPLRMKDGGVKRIIIPCFTWDPSRISLPLSKLCPRDEIQINPGTPDQIVGILARKNCEGWEKNHVTFDEKDAINRLQPSIDGCFPWQDEDAWRLELGDPNMVNILLDVLLKRMKCGEKLSVEDIQDLQKNMHLPDVHKNAIPYTELYSGIDLPTDLPNVMIPPILHPKVARHTLFRIRNWKPQQYKFHNFLEDSNLENSDEAIRQKFWQWIRKNWRSVPKKSWPRLAKIPIWPDQKGNLFPLSKLCYPKQSRARTILSEVLGIPSEEIFKLPIVKRKGRGGLKIRTQPSQDEISVYCRDHLSLFPRERALKENERIEFHDFEKDLVEISRDKDTAQKLKELSPDALALNQEGYLLTYESLHRVDREIGRVQLLKEDLIDRPAKKLDRIFPPRNQPALSAIVRALQQDPERIDILPTRLDAYLKAMRREEEPIEGIEDIQCIPVNGSLHSPSELAFLSNKGDYWGSWKIKLSGKGLSAEIQEIYRQVGVTSAEPKPHSSRQFFEWLNEQDDHFITRHLDCIVRHFNHPNAILSWCFEYDEIPCLPVQHDHDIRLVSWKVAINPRGLVFIPDFHELVQAIRNSEFNPRIMFAVIGHPKIRKPISDSLRERGVRSLREYASQPLSVYGVSEKETPSDLLARLEKLRSHRISKELRKRLADLDVNSDLLRSNWQYRVEQILSLKVASRINATYKIGRRHYNVIVDGAFCEDTGILWIADGENSLELRFYKNLADRIFTDMAPKWVAAALRYALQAEFHEQLWAIPSGDKREDGPFESDVSEFQDTENGNKGSEDPGETLQTHMGTEPDLTKNVPKPGPIPTFNHTTEKSPLTTPKMGMETKKGHHEDRFDPESEKIQIQDLKEKQYAWHCQICLAESTPEKLAPTGSYVEFQENRNRFIEAQHADQKHAGGARHAGNVLVLCHFHHHRYGNAMSRADVTNALRGHIIDREISFSAGSNVKKHVRTIHGIVATMKIPHTSEKIGLFFTKEHRNYWLEKAGEGRTRLLT